MIVVISCFDMCCFVLWLFDYLRFRYVDLLLLDSGVRLFVVLVVLLVVILFGIWLLSFGLVVPGWFLLFVFDVTCICLCLFVMV